MKRPIGPKTRHQKFDLVEHLPMVLRTNAQEGWRPIQRSDAMCKPVLMAEIELTREELEELIQTLRHEVTRLKEEIRRIRRDDADVPPHYL